MDEVQATLVNSESNKEKSGFINSNSKLDSEWKEVENSNLLNSNAKENEHEKHD